MPLLPEERPGGLDSPWAVRFIKVTSLTQVLAFNPTNGRVGGSSPRRAGSRRTRSGRPTCSHPDTTVSLEGERDRPVHARSADPDERAAPWPRLVDQYADFAKDQKWTEREIPVIVLEPR
jgi:F420H(2)-dependent quinone reductase